MAGTGYHPEGHRIEPIEEFRDITRAGQEVRLSVPAWDAGYRYICRNCCEVAKLIDGFSAECIDDHLRSSSQRKRHENK